MKNVVEARSDGIDPNVSGLVSIDDIRNGFLAWNGYHSWFGVGGFGFLRVSVGRMELGSEY